jgi:WD40 repeat protein
MSISGGKTEVAAAGKPFLAIPDHELLRVVGSGAYGEVWLARNVVGTLRAVKIVWRKNFQHDRPYEREFEGIRQFEPVSRTNDGLVDILHLGRNDSEGYFFYVMELADDAGPDPVEAASERPKDSDYIPLTLHEVSRRRGRFPIAECVEMGWRLAAALQHLHRSGLVHRDIKPSNIIFVGGVPKLADIGLVAQIDQARSFVGTEGFVPPEGPGAAQADIYSLGKVLYELATGLDRNDFPKLPETVGLDRSSLDEFAEFNEIIIKACEQDSRRRYRTADELRGDLVLLQGGKSLRRLRRLEWRVALATRVGIVATILALLTLGAYFGSFKQFRRARQAERQARENVALLQLQKAEDLFREDNASAALAYLAHVVRNNPTNRVAAERLISALTWRPFVLPKFEPIIPTGRPWTAAFSPDDREIVTTSYAGAIEFWDCRTGALRESVARQSNRVWGIEFTADGKRVLFAAHNTAFLWDRATLRSIIEPLQHLKRIATIHFSPDQTRIVTSSAEGAARVWDARTGAPITEAIEHPGALRDAVFSPDGQRIATACADRAARIFDANTGKLLSEPLKHEALVSSVSFSPDGSKLLSTSDDHTARLWEAVTGKLVFILQHKHTVSDANFSPDGQKIVTASEDSTAVIWDASTGLPLGAPIRHGSWVRTAEFSPDGGRVVTAAEDNTVRLWDASTGLPISEPMRHGREVWMARFSHDGQRIFAMLAGPSSDEGSIWIWGAASIAARSLPLLKTDSANHACFSPTSGQIAVACQDSVVRLCSPGNFFADAVSLPQSGPVKRVSFSPDGSRLVAVTSEDKTNTARVWDVATHRPLAAPLVHPKQIASARFSSDGQHVVTASDDAMVRIWDAHSGELTSSIFREPPVNDHGQSGIFYAEFSPDGQYVLMASRDGRARLWQPSKRQIVATFRHRHWVVYSEFSPDGSRVVTASVDRSARIWDARTGRQVGSTLVHDNDLVTAHFSPDGRRIVTASMDWTARVWDAATGLPVSEPLKHEGPVRSARFSPDGRRIVTGSDDRTARLWDAATGLALSDAFRQKSAVTQVEFSPDGNSILVVPKEGSIEIYEAVPTPPDSPGWLPDLAEAVGAKKLTSQNMLDVVPPSAFFKLKQRLAAMSDSDFYSRWAHWFFADLPDRTVSPNVGFGFRSYIQRRIQENVTSSLREALWLAPTNAQAHAHLARQLATQDLPANSGDSGEALFHKARAQQLAPADADVAEIRSLAVRSNLAKASPISR